MADPLTARAQGRVDTLQVIVKEETPFLPKVAFTLITLASLGGATFVGFNQGLGVAGGLLRWLTLWSLALAGGFLAWRVFYLRDVEPAADADRVDALNRTALARADKVGRLTAIAVLLGAPGVLVVPYLMGATWLVVAMALGSVAVGAALLAGVGRRPVAAGAFVVVLATLAGWAFIDAGTGLPWVLRILHLTAFSLWLGGALWNIAVAMPAGRAHPNVDAVLAGANQLDRFRWVVRFVLPTIIATGAWMAWSYVGLPASWWLAFPGVLIPLKVLAIVALVVVFITCPLFRHCSPVQGVCNIDDLQEADRR